MKLAKSEVPKRVSVKVSRNIRQHEGVNGIMFFGEKNDYPQVIENIILSSVTAKATAGIYAKFLAGKGFTQEMNAAVVGIDQFVALTLLGLDAVLLENVNLEHVQDGSLDVLRPHLLALGEDDFRDHAVSKNQ